MRFGGPCAPGLRRGPRLGYTHTVQRASGQQRVFEAIGEVATRKSFDRASSATELFMRMLRAQGGLRRVEDELVAGDLVLNRDRELLPMLSESTGMGFCVYLGNRRIATSTVLDAGTAPEVGGFAEAPLVDAVLRRRDALQTRLEYNGRPYIVVARPLHSADDPEGAPIGIIEAFQDEQAFFDSIAATTRATFQRERDQMTQRADSMEAIIKFIDDVARRLQLLSLNGNIIAAQAGEHGRAFRVVCRELGGLADESKLTAAEVRKLITAMGLEEFTSEAEMYEYEDLQFDEGEAPTAEATPAPA